MGASPRRVSFSIILLLKIKLCARQRALHFTFTPEIWEFEKIWCSVKKMLVWNITGFQLVSNHEFNVSDCYSWFIGQKVRQEPCQVRICLRVRTMVIVGIHMCEEKALLPKHFVNVKTKTRKFLVLVTKSCQNFSLTRI